LNTVNGKREQIGIWLQAARPRTLTLAVAGVAMGIFLAGSDGAFDLTIAVLTLLTASLLQILSNLANDYGDTVHGADHAQRSGPSRAVQSGQVSAQSMRRAILVVAASCGLSGILLLWLALGVDGLLIMAGFLLLGALAIWAAISYTAGRLPYGYVGLGDLAVLLFFGWVGVLGSYYLQALELPAVLLLPATSCGFFAVAVLNVNNIRDIDSDRMAGKKSIPVRIGLRRARIYHWLLLLGGFAAALMYVVIDYHSPWQLLFLASAPLFVQNGRAVSSLSTSELNPYLGRLSLATLLFVICFGIGQLLA
jgi:1,4-dihydroxy-2-naphthoate octaprenyltransferase